MTEDSVMLSLRELHALEERRLLEEEELTRKAIEAERDARSRAAMLAAKQADEAAAAAEEKRKQALREEGEQRAREKAIGDAELLRVRLAAEAAEQARISAALYASALPANAAPPPAPRFSRLLGATTFLGSAAAIALSLVAYRAEERSHAAAEAARVRAGEVDESRASLARLREEVTAKEEQVRALQRALADARPAAPLPAPAGSAHLGAVKTSTTKSREVPSGHLAVDESCPKGDPICGFKKP